MSEITREDIKKVADLAQIAVTDVESDALRKDIEPVLGYFDTLSAIKTDGIEGEGHITRMTNVMRRDRVQEMSDDERIMMMDAVPVSDGDRIVVKGVL